MRSGNRRHPRPEPATAALAVLILAGLCSCASGNRFEDALERLDRSLDGRTTVSASPERSQPTSAPAETAEVEKLIRAASRRAESSQDWLRVLARAFRASEALGNPFVAVRAAEEARKVFPTYEDIALCACRAYIDAGRAVDALDLFPAPLDPAVRGGAFAEAFLAACGEAGGAAKGSEDAEVLRRVSDYSGRWEPAVNAALLRMHRGDRTGAALLLRQARSMGAAVDPDLAWDAGVLDMVLSDPNRSTEGADLLRKADAALLMNEKNWAQDYLTELVLSFPSYSWKPYAALASLEQDENRRDFWMSRMMELFPGEREAVRARAAYLATRGRPREALETLESAVAEGAGDARTAVLTAEIRARMRPDDSFPAQALRLSNEYPEDPYVQKWALGVLAASERYRETAELYRQIKSRGMDLGRPWYFEALSWILAGSLEEAIEEVERGGPADAGPEAPYALGVLYARAGRYDMSVERFRIAASRSGTPESKARALTEMGKSMAAKGNLKEARETWAAALSVCPDYAEALRLFGSR